MRVLLILVVVTTIVACSSSSSGFDNVASARNQLMGKSLDELKPALPEPRAVRYTTVLQNDNPERPDGQGTLAFIYEYDDLFVHFDWTQKVIEVKGRE